MMWKPCLRMSLKFSATCLLASVNPIGCTASSIPDDGRPRSLTRGIEVALRHGSSLRVIDTLASGAATVQLQGTARFRASPERLAPTDSPYLVVFTRAASIATVYGEFQVVARGDTTDIAVSRMPAVANRHSDVVVTRAGRQSPSMHVQEGTSLHIPDFR
jgi:hypothetical protein